MHTRNTYRNVDMTSMKSEKRITTLINDLTAEKKKYPPDAYFFVLEALNFTQENTGSKQHISGQQLLAGIRKYALQQYGPMTLTVLRHWNISSTLDFGEIVFDLVSLTVIRKTQQDSIEDFRDGYNFEEVFEPQ